MAKKISQLSSRGTVVPATPLPQDSDAIEVAIAGVDSYNLSLQGLREYVAANFLPLTDNVSDVGSAAFRFNDGFFGGVVTAASFVGAAAAGSLSGTTLAANVVASSLTSVGTLTSLTVSGTTALAVTTLSAKLTLGVGGYIIGDGTNGFRVNNAADTDNNFVVTNAGVATIRAGLTVSAGTTAVQALTATTATASTALRVERAFSDTYDSGAHITLQNVGATNRWTLQPNTANGLSIWYYDGGAYSYATWSTAGGLTLDQYAADGAILTLRSSDVAHGMTDTASTSSYGELLKAHITSGGVNLRGFTEDVYGVYLNSYHTNDDTSKTTSSNGSFVIAGHKKSGSGSTNFGVNANIAVFQDHNTTRFILDSDGDSHQDVGTAWTNFDTMDDVKALNILAAHVTRRDDPLRESFGVFLQEERDFLERAKIVSFNSDGHHFVNMSKLTMLHTGAIRQLGGRVDRIEAENALLRNELALLKSGRAATQLLTA